MPHVTTVGEIDPGKDSPAVVAFLLDITEAEALERFDFRTCCPGCKPYLIGPKETT